jgi:hypothetical protein
MARDSVVLGLLVSFDDAIVLGQHLAAQLRGDGLTPPERQALRRVYDEVARAGAADWTHNGIAKRSDADSGDLVYRLRKRAAIRRQIPSRRAVQEGKPDRMADLLDEPADEIERLRGMG